MSYDVIRDFKKIQSFKELQERNAMLIAALEKIASITVSGHRGEIYRIACEALNPTPR